MFHNVILVPDDTIQMVTSKFQKMDFKNPIYGARFSVNFGFF